ncbi:hypothetical protein P3T37_004759 [Kitasatospora sp. MAA4]|uniref:DUF1254 domain-containing protein n=1 Tax=Kitasatospora sp. MAA4 TaxID=3035093 RepID=UPI002474C8E3|nr:DUF1254 domain-containing protein [Kitasatospora sp. MAA4]MDH6135344.1 hypothetical protein [Kitasatospora sp. MAA4]
MPEHDHVALSALAADAYVYGYPLVFDLSMVDRFLREGFGSVRPVAPNRFSHGDKLAGPQDDFVSVNNDTVYSVAQLDLSEGPQVLHVPDFAGAYYVLQFVDAWTNNFAYVGRRATGTAEQTWLIVPSGWHGTPPDGMPVITSPTTVASIVGRSACQGPADLARVAGLQRQLTLSALEPGGVPAGLPQPDPAVPEELRFFERLRLWMAAFPPAAPDVEYQQRFAPLGLLDTGASPYTAAHADWADALVRGLAAGKERVEAATRPPEGQPVGDWSANLHLFDYNIDHLGPGTVDDPQWRIPDRRAAYLTRAVAARAGLWGNHAYEAVYASTFADSEGKQLTGAHAYTLRFDDPPPVEAFWSVTMYALPDYYLVANPIERYSIGDRTPGLVYAEDGSLTLYLQRERPATEATAANWLPTPEGEFRPMIRLYQPKSAVLEGAYRLPPIQAVRQV